MTVTGYKYAWWKWRSIVCLIVGHDQIDTFGGGKHCYRCWKSLKPPDATDKEPDV